MNITWETLVSNDGTLIVKRAPVPGGWLVVVNNNEMVFVADATDTWADAYSPAGSSTTASSGTSTTTTTTGGTTTGGTSTGGTTTGGTTTGGATTGGTTSGGTNTGGTTTTTTTGGTTGTTTTGGTTTGGVTTGGTTTGGTTTGTTTGGTTVGGTTSGGTTTTTTTQLYYIFNSGVQNAWRDYSYTGTFGTDATGDKTAVLGAYGAISFNNNNDVPVASQNYLGVQFNAKASAAVTVDVTLTSDETTVVSKAVNLTTTMTTYTLLWSDLGLPAFGTFTNVTIANPSSKAMTATVSVNNLSLLVNPNPSSVTVPTAPVDSSPVSGANATVNWLTVKNNKLVDSVTGQAWMGRGVVVEDVYLGGQGVGTAFTSTVPEVIRRIGWAYNLGCDYFRLLLQEFDSSGKETSSGSVLNNPAYLAAVKQIVAYVGTLKGARVNVCIDISYSLSPQVGGAATAATIPEMALLASSFYQCPWVMLTAGNEPSYSTAAEYTSLLSVYNQIVQSVRTVENNLGSKNRLLLGFAGVSNYARNVQYFVTNPVQDAYNASFFIAHIYDTNGDSWEKQYIASAPSIPLICEEFGPVSGTMSTSDCTEWQAELETLKTPYTGWALSAQESPTMLVDNSKGTNGVGMTLQLSAWGLQFINALRQAKGLGTVDLNGNPVA